MKKRKLLAQLAAADKRLEELVERIVADGSKHAIQLAQLRQENAKEQLALLEQLETAKVTQNALQDVLRATARRVGELDGERATAVRERKRAESRLGVAAMGQAWREAEAEWKQASSRAELPS